MKYSLKSILLGASFLASSWATNAGAVTFAGSSTWQFSPALTDLVGIPLFPAGNDFIELSELGPGAVTEHRSYEPLLEHDRLVGVDVSTRVSSVQLTAEATIASVQHEGGITLTTPSKVGLSLGGQLSITDFSIDMSSKRVYATITGNFTGAPLQLPAPVSNTTVSTIQSFHLFDFSTTSLLNPPSLGETSSYTFSNLTLTADGFGHIVSSLRLGPMGSNAWLSILSHGSITTTISAVPEPATYCLVLAGGVAIGIAKRRSSLRGH